jgi:secondary thiamine-phosphate synthase enzyme
MIEIQTKKETDVADITPLVAAKIKASGIKSGICLVYTLHTTTAVAINEAEDGLMEDILTVLNDLVPPGEEYSHAGDDNAHAHVQASLIGNSVVVPVENGAPALGTWQRILFLELDGPRRRRIDVKVLKE